MSAFLLPNNHTNALLSFAKAKLRGRRLYAKAHAFNLDNDDEYELAGKTLRDANELSLRARYPSNCEDSFKEYPYKAEVVPIKNLRDEDIINAVDCFHYQSCEHFDYYNSLAYFITEAIKSLAVDSLVRDKPKVWVIDDLNNLNR